MGDIQFWLYVIIGIIYLVSRLRKKPQVVDSDVPADKTRPDRTRSDRRMPETRTSRETVGEERPLTFEELLREITEGKSEPEPRPVQEHKPVLRKPAYTNYDEEVEDEVDEKKTVLEDVNYDYRTRDSLYKQYEDAKSEAFERKSLEETLSLSSTDMIFGKFKEFELKRDNHPAREYLKDLYDPENLKKAFVLSEILERKF